VVLELLKYSVFFIRSALDVSSSPSIATLCNRVPAVILLPASTVVFARLGMTTTGGSDVIRTDTNDTTLFPARSVTLYRTWYLPPGVVSSMFGVRIMVITYVYESTVQKVLSADKNELPHLAEVSD